MSGRGKEKTWKKRSEEGKLVSDAVLVLRKEKTVVL